MNAAVCHASAGVMWDAGLDERLTPAESSGPGEEDEGHRRPQARSAGGFNAS